MAGRPVRRPADRLDQIAGMPRLRQVPRTDADPRAVLPMYDFLFGDRDPVTDPGTATGTPGDWWTVFALVPDIFAHCVGGFRVYRNPARRLDPLLRELGQHQVISTGD